MEYSHSLSVSIDLGIGYRVSGIRYQVSGIGVLCLRYRVLGLGYWVSGIGYWVLGIGYRGNWAIGAGETLCQGDGGTRRADDSPPPSKKLSKNPSRQSLVREIGEYKVLAKSKPKNAQFLMLLYIA